jgi:Tol biopolymer transport system component
MLPITWADRHLSGKLVFTAGTQGVLQLDLLTGELATLFAPPDPINSWVVAAARSPVAESLVMAYTPPPPEGGVQFGYYSLFTLNLAGGSLPEPLFGREITKETFFNPTWSPDGLWLYYVHVTAPVTATASSHFAIERVQLPGGAPEVVVEDAFWLRLSPDGRQLVYVHYDQLTGANTLFVSAANGSQPRNIPLPATFQSVDSPMFTPDGASIVFSGINGFGPAALSWLDRLFGVQVAYADGSPADWYTIPVAGGQPQQMTHINDTGMYGAFAPDGQQIAYISSSGLFLMNVDGTGILQLLGVKDLPGSVGVATVNWLP